MAQVYSKHGGAKCNASKYQHVWFFYDSLDYKSTQKYSNCHKIGWKDDVKQDVAY